MDALEEEVQRDRQRLPVICLSSLGQKPALMAKAAVVPVLFQDWWDLGMQWALSKGQPLVR